MAIYDSQTQSKSTRNSRNYRDIDLDFARNPVTNDVNVVEDVIAIKRAVKNLVQTNFYERPFHPELGCGIRGLLFENYSPLLNVFLKRKIEECLMYHEPRINLNGIVINGDDFEYLSEDRVISGDIDSNTLRVEIYFNIIGVPHPQSVSITLQRLR